MTDTGVPPRFPQHGGTGPGAFTPDGCSVRLYARLPANDEPEIISSAVPPGATLLELGSGAGRVTHPLLALGFRVTAVDESEAMLAVIQGARTVRSTIEGLDLGERFDAVVLASFLVNTAVGDRRGELLTACARHVSPGGCVLVQRQGRWHESLRAGSAWERGGMTVRVTHRDPVGEGAQRLRMEYVFEDAAWSHTFVARPLTDEDFERALVRAGLVLDRYLDDDRSWARAVPLPE